MASPGAHTKPVIFIGHSFVARLEQYCRALSIENVGLQPAACQFSFLPKSGGRLDYAYEALSTVQFLAPEGIIVQLGGNDLNDVTCQPRQLAQDIFAVVRKMLQTIPTLKMVLICQLGYRRDPVTGPHPKHPLRMGYNNLVDEVNHELMWLAQFFPKIRVWKHRGMHDWCSILSSDGVHLDLFGQRLYFRSIRGAALYLAKLA